MAGASQHGYDPVTPICFLACTFTSLAFLQMAPNLNHLLNSSCYSVTYPPSTESSDTNNHSPTGSTTLQQHLSPISDLPPYYPGSQHTLSLDRRNASDTQLSDPAPSKSQLLSSDYPLVPPYYPMPLMNNLGIAQPNVVPNYLPNHFPPHFANTIFFTPVKQRLGTARPLAFAKPLYGST